MKHVKYQQKKVVVYARCKQNNYACKKFKFVTADLVLSVYSSSINFNQEKFFTTYVKGVEREIFKEKLLSTKPTLYKNAFFLQSDCHIMEYDNLQNIKSDPTLRKIRSEALAHLDRDKNQLFA